MNKVLKIVLGVVGIVILLIVVDLICVFTIYKPLLAIQTKEPYKYTGLFYDTYNCPEYSIPQIKSKGTKFSCAIKKEDIGKVVELVDETKKMKDFVCFQAYESFYEDDKYIYFWGCIKNEYMIVRYESGYEETISDALKYGTITINDLDDYNISYIKESKQDIVKYDIVADNGLLFSINWKKTDCIPVQLNVYDNGKYNLAISYEACRPNENCNSMLKYTVFVKGSYNYDVMKIIQSSTIADDMSFTNESRSEYEIYTGNGEKVYMLITDSNNEYLKKFLDQIDVNLNTCAEPDYK